MGSEQYPRPRGNTVFRFSHINLLIGGVSVGLALKSSQALLLHRGLHKI